METLLRIALWNVALAAAFAALAFAVSRSVRRPALAHMLWVLALLKLLTPPLWTIGVAPSAPNLAGSQRGEIVAVHTTALSVQTDVAVAPPATAASAHRLPASRPYQWVLPAALVGWGLVSTACLAFTVVRIRQFRRTLRHASSDPGLQRRVDQLAIAIGLRRPPSAWLVPGRVCPMVWWTLGRPKLILPAQLWTELTDAQRDSLILHELAHLKRRDHWVRVVELLATVIYWWDPLVWWARHELRIAEEQCCDAWVTRAMPASEHVYASALMDAVDFMSSSGSISSPRLPALASGMGEFRHLQRRLVMIQQGISIRPLGRTGFLMICAAALLLPLSFTRGQSSSREASGPSAHDRVTDNSPATQPSGDDDPASAALFNRMVPQIQLDEVGLADAISFLRDVTGANVFVNWKSLNAAGIDKNTPVSVQLKNVKFSKVLDMVLDSASSGQARMAYYFDHNVLTITTAEEAAKNTVTHVYDVKDLLSSGDAKDRAAELIKAIENSCAPDSWRANGGSIGAISPVDSMLVVVQTEENQRLVKDLLAKTRKARKDASAR